jgi:hypothetical protein
LAHWYYSSAVRICADGVAGIGAFDGPGSMRG